MVVGVESQLSIMAVALQLWNGSYCRARWTEEGREYVNPKQIREQLSFARMWARNLRDQGW